MIRRVLVQSDAHKAPQRQRVRQPPGNPALRPDALEIPDQQRPKLYCVASAASVTWVCRFSFHPRTVCRSRFKAAALTAGRKLVKIRRCLLSAFLGRNVKPRNVKFTCGYGLVRLLSLQ